MSENPSSSRPISPLSVGDVVSAGVRIYRDHFKLYYGLAFTGYLWILIPVYGWAKFSAISGLLSRLAFCELIERPETVDDARRHVMPRMWSFLGAGFLSGLIISGVVIGAVLAFGILGGVLAAILGQSLEATIILGLLGLIAVIVLILLYLWIVSRLFIVEVPLAVEDNVDATSAISRSWKLIKGSVLRLILVVTVAFLISLPITIVVQIISIIIQGVLTALLPTDSPIFFLLYYVLILGLSFASGALLIPFWQAIKAVVYCDLRSRREGLGLEIRDSR